VVRLPSWEYGKVRQGVLTMGWILGHEEDAYRYIKWYDNIYSSIVKKVASIDSSDKVSVLITSGTQAHSYGSGDFESSVIAGGNNIGSSLYTGNKYITYENEWVIEQNPDIIIGTVRAGYNGNYSGLLPLYVTLEGALNITDAVKSGGLHILSYDILTGPGSIISLAYMAKWFYPQLFADLDPEALHQEYIDQFLGGAVDVSALDSFAL
jgi:iron complex transport system substrate-binding protein